jgi:hypothetical protein
MEVLATLIISLFKHNYIAFKSEEKENMHENFEKLKDLLPSPKLS